MKFNYNSTGTDSCILFAPQDEGYMGKKILMTNLTRVIERMINIQDTKLYTDIAENSCFEKAEYGVSLVLTRKAEESFDEDAYEEEEIFEEEKREILIPDYIIIDPRQLDNITKEMIDFFRINFAETHSAETVLGVIKESREVKRMNRRKKDGAADTGRPALCKADELASYVMFSSRIGSGINVSRYSRESLEILLFYIRALSLTCGKGPVFEGTVMVKNGRLMTPAADFLKSRESEGKLYLRTEYRNSRLDPVYKELADTVLALAPDTDEEIKKSLDYHPCFTNKVLMGFETDLSDASDKSICPFKDGPCCSIFDWDINRIKDMPDRDCGKCDIPNIAKNIIRYDEIIADFSTWETAKEACDKKVKQLKGSAGGHLALPVLD